MHQTRTCTPSGCDVENRCVDDYSLGEWTNQTCGGNDCTSEQMYQTGPTFYDCYTAERCADDSCDGWSDASCGGDDCPASQMYQTRTCAYQCESEFQCDPRVLDSPVPTVDPDCGGGETLFDFSWTVPGASTCPVEPVEYLWQVDGGDWSPPLEELTVSAGPYGDGDHDFYVKTQDASERESSPGTVSFGVDAQGPGTPDPSYAPSCGLVTGTEVTFFWDPVTDEGCAGGTIEYAWNVDNGAAGPWSDWQSGTSATWTAETGEHVFYVKARDGLGNESEVGSVTVGVDCFDGPTIEIVVDECTRADKQRPYWSWTATPNCAPGMRETDTYQVFLDDDPTEAGVNLVDQGFQDEDFFQPSVDLDDGYYALVVRGFDICDQFHDEEAPEDAYVDYTAPVFTSFFCFQGLGEGEDMEACAAGICSQNNYVRFEWEATDPGSYPSGLRTENTFYWYVNFEITELPGRRNGYLDETYWGPYQIADNEAPRANQFNVVAIDACGNDGNPVPGTIPGLLIDTNPPISTTTSPGRYIY